jgi:hypothetical protein
MPKYIRDIIGKLGDARGMHKQMDLTNISKDKQLLEELEVIQKNRALWLKVMDKIVKCCREIKG